MSKRVKLSEAATLMRWRPLLADEYLRSHDQFSLGKFMVGDIVDIKAIAPLVARLQHIYPTTVPTANGPRFKRIRKVGTGALAHFQVLLGARDLYKPAGELANADDAALLSRCVANVREVDLPVDKVLTRRQYEAVSTLYWPVQYHCDKRVESLLDGSYFELERAAAQRHDLYARCVLALARHFDVASAALAVDPRTDSLVAVGLDRRRHQPLAHSTMQLVDQVARRQLGEASSHGQVDELIASGEFASFLKAFDSSSSRVRIARHTSPDDYLCTGYELYLSHEPCSMCAMASVHARASRLFYVFPTRYGYLATRSKLHCLAALNHNYEAFEAAELPHEDDSAQRSYFYTDVNTRHVNISLNKQST